MHITHTKYTHDITISTPSQGTRVPIPARFLHMHTRIQFLYLPLLSFPLFLCMAFRYPMLMLNGSLYMYEYIHTNIHTYVLYSRYAVEPGIVFECVDKYIHSIYDFDKHRPPSMRRSNAKGIHFASIHASHNFPSSSRTPNRAFIRCITNMHSCLWWLDLCVCAFMCECWCACVCLIVSLCK